MTQTNEEIVEEFEKTLSHGNWGSIERNYIYKILTTKEAEKADWLRSEIEKLEGLIKGLVEHKETFPAIAITHSIITRYKEELLELEKGV